MSETVATISAAASAMAAVVAIILIYLQVRAQNKQLRQSALISLHEEILQSEIQRAIRFVYASRPEDLAHPQSEEALERIELVLNRYDLIGSRMRHGVIPRKLTLQTEWPVVLRLNAQLSYFIESETDLRGTGTPYKPGFKWLVGESSKYQKRKHPSSLPRVFPRAYSPPTQLPVHQRPHVRPPRIVFISGHAFGLRSLAAMLNSHEHRESQISFPLIVTVMQDRRLSNAGVASLADLAQEHGLPHLAVRSVKASDTYQRIRDVRPDYIIAIGLSQLLPSTLLDLPKDIHQASSRHAADHAAIGMHPTLLPTGRGRAPVPWTIIKGLKETGVSVFLLQEMPDSGPIIAQRSVVVSAHETATTLFEKVTVLHEELAVELAKKLAARDITGTPQSEAGATVWPRRTLVDSEISFTSSAEDVDRLVRAQADPYPSAYFIYKGGTVLVHEVAVVRETPGDSPGRIQVVSEDGTPLIRCGTGCVKLTAFEAPSNVVFQQGDMVLHTNSAPTG